MVDGRAHSGGEVVLRLVGELAAGQADLLRCSIRAEIRPRARIIIDLSEVTALDGTALRVLLRAILEAREREASLRLAALSPALACLTRLAGLQELLPVYPTVEAALNRHPSGE